MSFRGNYSQSAQGFDTLMIDFPLRSQFFDSFITDRWINRSICLQRRQGFFNISAQHDIGSSSRHIGCNRDRPRASRLCNNVCLAGVLLGIKNLMRQFLFIQKIGNNFRIFDTGCSHKNRLAASMAFLDVCNGCRVFFLGCLIDSIQLIIALIGTIGWNYNCFQSVYLLKLISFGISRPRHTGQLVIQTEIILECNRRQSLVFRLYRHPLFCFNCLV